MCSAVESSAGMGSVRSSKPGNLHQGEGFTVKQGA